MLFLEACAEQVEPFHTAHITPKTAVFKRNTNGLITRLCCVECSLPYFYMASELRLFVSGLVMWLGADSRFFVLFCFARALQEARFPLIISPIASLVCIRLTAVFRRGAASFSSAKRWRRSADVSARPSGRAETEEHTGRIYEQFMA